MFWFSLQRLSVKFLILRRTERDVIKIVCWSSCEVPVLSDFNGTRIFSTDFRKMLKYNISWISVQRKPSCSMRTDGQTWRSSRSFFAILRTPLEAEKYKMFDQLVTWVCSNVWWAWGDVWWICGDVTPVIRLCFCLKSWWYCSFWRRNPPECTPVTQWLWQFRWFGVAKEIILKSTVY